MQGIHLVETVASGALFTRRRNEVRTLVTWVPVPAAEQPEYQMFVWNAVLLLSSHQRDSNAPGTHALVMDDTKLDASAVGPASKASADPIAAARIRPDISTPHVPTARRHENEAHLGMCVCVCVK